MAEPMLRRRVEVQALAEITGSKTLADLAVSDVLWDKVVSIERHLIDQGVNSFWAICIDYLSHVDATN